MGSLGSSGRKAVSITSPAGWFAARLADDDPPGRGGRVGPDLQELERLRVEDRAVPGDVEEHDRVLGEGRVEVAPGDVPLLGEADGVVAVADDPVAGLGLLAGRLLAERGQDVGDGPHRTDRRERDVGPVGDDDRGQEVGVGVDEAGEERALAQRRPPSSPGRGASSPRTSSPPRRCARCAPPAPRARAAPPPWRGWRPSV